jgi:hypothetical protein
MKYIDWRLVVLIFILFATGNAAEYFHKADINGWFNPLWERGVHALHWADWLDWIPYDACHIRQTLSNTVDKLAVVIVGL